MFASTLNSRIHTYMYGFLLLLAGLMLWAGQANAKVDYTGVNLAGLEFGGKGDLNPATYVSNGKKYYDYWRSIGGNIIRLPFQWERVQHDRFGGLNGTYLGYLKDGVNYAKANNMVLVLDMHNYARYKGAEMANDNGLKDAYADVWRKLANEFKGESHVWFNIMNEPHDITSARWIEFAQIATDAIRSTGAGNRIVVPTVDWSGAHRFNDGGFDRGPYESFRDPGNNYMFEVHQYLDDCNCGFSANSVGGKGSSVLRG